MTGNIPELNNPALYGENNGNYPNAFFLDDDYTPQPSIQGRILYIPLNNWFTMKSQLAFPLISFCNKNYLILEIDFNPGPRNCCLTTNSSTILCTFRFFFCMLSLGREREREREREVYIDGKIFKHFRLVWPINFRVFSFLVQN